MAQTEGMRVWILSSSNFSRTRWKAVIGNATGGDLVGIVAIPEGIGAWI